MLVLSSMTYILDKCLPAWRHEVRPPSPQLLWDVVLLLDAVSCRINELVVKVQGLGLLLFPLLDTILGLLAELSERHEWSSPELEGHLGNSTLPLVLTALQRTSGLGLDKLLTQPAAGGTTTRQELVRKLMVRADSLELLVAAVNLTQACLHGDSAPPTTLYTLSEPLQLALADQSRTDTVVDLGTLSVQCTAGALGPLHQSRCQSLQVLLDYTSVFLYSTETADTQHSLLGFARLEDLTLESSTLQIKSPWVCVSQPHERSRLYTEQSTASLTLTAPEASRLARVTVDLRGAPIGGPTAAAPPRTRSSRQQQSACWWTSPTARDAWYQDVVWVSDGTACCSAAAGGLHTCGC